MIFDTGSADLWVFSSQIVNKVNVHHYFYDYRSSTYSPMGDGWSIEYGKGSANGFLSRDIVILGNASSPFVATNQIFAEVTQYSSNAFDDIIMDGIMGLAFSDAATSRAPTVIDSLLAANSISQRIFSFRLTRADTDGSVMVVGSPDPQFYDKNLGITYLSTVTDDNNGIGPGMWWVDLSHIFMNYSVSGMEDMNACAKYGSKCVALMDTGTSSLIVDERLFAENILTSILKHRSDCAYNSIIHCSSLSLHNLPTFYFHLYDRLFPLTPEMYTVVETSGRESVLYITIQPMPAILNADDSYYFFIFGDTFLHNYYVIFDMDNAKVGIANTPLTQTVDVISDPSSSSSYPFGLNQTTFYLFVALVCLAAFAMLYIVVTMIRRRCNRRPATPTPYVSFVEQNSQQPAAGFNSPFLRDYDSSIQNAENGERYGSGTYAALPRRS